ncbi:hypothetical protein [Lewinella cohaerens]|uniref:hypothetical protein n=1 Tax=Lewinella cohaerens TaxID=70995 RepID=UPI00035C7106|nr:hypothetical protein [Lewinella cohaerens]
MDDKFEDKIRESLNSPPDYPFEERVWQNLEGRLDQLDKGQPRSGFPFWWLPLLAAAIPLLLLFWLWGAYQQQGAELTYLQQRTPHEQMTIMDTIVRRMVIVEYDTIYRTVYETHVTGDDSISKYRQPSSSLLLGTNPSFPSLWTGRSSQNSTAPNRWFPKEPIPVTLSPWPRWSAQSNTNEERNTTNPGDLVVGQPTNIIRDYTPTTPLPFRFFFLNYSEEQKLPTIVVPTIEQRKKTLPGRLASVLPSAIKVGFSAGSFATTGLPEVEKQSNFSGALLAELSYNRHFSIVLGGEYLANTFDLKHDDDVDFSEFPLLPPNTPGDELEKLQGDFRYWQIPLGIKYRMLVKKRLSPYLGVGLMAIRPTQSLLNYEYENSSNDYYSLSQDDLLGKQLLLEDAWLMLGFDYYLGKNWHILLDANAQWSFHEVNNIIENREFLKIRMGFGYSF